MAKRGRKPKTISALKNGDERDLFKAIHRVRVIHEDDIPKYFPDISPKRLKLMKKDGNWLKREKGKTFTMGQDAINYMESNMGMTFRYSSKETAYKHDKLLSKEYLSYSKEKRELWVTENYVRQDLHSRKEYWEMYNDPKWEDKSKKFVLDAGIIDKTGRIVEVIEVVTKNYTEQDVQQKLETAEKFYNGNIKILT